jgi:MerR family copper efflux transcriptional regulator
MMLRSGELAKQAGVTVETLRYYHQQALLPEPQKTAGGYRCYTSNTVERILFIKRCQSLGFSLKEIKELLLLQDDATHGAGEVKALTVAKIEVLTEKIALLQEIKLTLTQLAQQCTGIGSVTDCSILKALNTEEPSLRKVH